MGDYYALMNSYIDNFTEKGRKIKVKMKNGKMVQALVLSCIGAYADVEIDRKKYLVNKNFNVA